ncbi:GNAT family N-acetyltransferase [Sulfobacillus thermosulfidooxidans]|uniref:GNAT family N-acetyltransferase n=1 Tax=Sulfobacillus thermosulfidooxidans TaxID=28034 RepID=UPI0006B63745|nr:GNAT family N-acetyltransferase [Sulfobacillus thermosulfidooxidans]
MAVDAVTFFDRASRPYVIREATVEDALDIITVIKEVGTEGQYIANEGEYYTLEQQRHILQNRNPAIQLILVAVVDNRVVGTLEAIRGTFTKNRHVATMGMVLRQGFRGQGRGSGLIKVLELWARQHEIAKIAISVFETNGPALHFYQRHGFVIEAMRPNQFVIDGKMVAEVFMAKYLGPLGT